MRRAERTGPREVLRPAKRGVSCSLPRTGPLGKYGKDGGTDLVGEPVPEPEQRLVRVTGHVRFLLAYGVHRRRQLEREPSFGLCALEDDVEHRLVRGAEHADDSGARL